MASEKQPLLGQSGSIGANDVIDVTALTGETTVPPKSSSKKRWLSLYVIYFTMFLSAITFSIVISSIYPFLQSITDDNASTSFLGYVVAVYSLGQLIASPIFGFWSDHQPSLIPIMVSLLITVVFNLLYAFSAAFPICCGKYILLIARALVGVGAANAAVCRSYASAATTEAERTGVFGVISAAQAVGFIVGPILGLVFVPLGGNGLVVKAIEFRFNMYTGPAYLSALLALINMILVLALFREYRLVQRKNGFKKMKNINSSANYESTSIIAGINSDPVNTPVKPYDRIGAVVCIVLFFAVLYVFSVYETIVTPYSMDEFAWTNKQGVLYNGILFGLVSIISATMFISSRFIVKCIDERTALMGGFILMAAAIVVMMPMGNEFPKIGVLLISQNYNFSVNSSQVPYIDLINSTNPVGCRYPTLLWCTNVPQLYLFQYILAVIILTLGYPTAVVLCFSIFSKILGPNPQGIMMGLITASGSFARCTGPLSITFLYDKFGPQVALAAVDGVLGIAIILLAFTYYRLVPYGSPKGMGKKL